MQSVRDAGHDITGKNITVMGVGGASMAICAQSALDGAASVHIFARRTSRYWNRTQKFAENLSAKTGCQVCLFDNICHYKLRMEQRCIFDDGIVDIRNHAYRGCVISR